MERDELARENHLFLVTKVPHCMFGEDFQCALGCAYVLMKNIQKYDRDPRPEDFCHCGFEAGYVGITAPAAWIIKDKDIDLFEMPSALYQAFGQDADTGEVNNRVIISLKGFNFTFTITDYETNDPEKGWTDCTKDPLSVPSGQTMRRRVIIGLATQ